MLNAMALLIWLIVAATTTYPSIASAQETANDARFASSPQQTLANQALELMIDHTGAGRAEALLAIYYLTGQKIEADPEAARAWFERAAAVGHPAGFLGAAKLLSENYGAAKDLFLARKILETADPALFGNYADVIRKMRRDLGLSSEPQSTATTTTVSAAMAAAASHAAIDDPILVEKPAPVEEKPAPVVEKPAPVEEKPIPVVEKPAPVVEKLTPVEEKPAPVVESPEPSHHFETQIKSPMAPIVSDQVAITAVANMPTIIPSPTLEKTEAPISQAPEKNIETGTPAEPHVRLATVYSQMHAESERDRLHAMFPATMLVNRTFSIRQIDMSNNRKAWVVTIIGFQDYTQAQKFCAQSKVECLPSKGKKQK
ncbi:exported hypothetical protein [Azospirillaceae bacterium]